MVTFPKPDRSTFRPNLIPNEEINEYDIGWAEGQFRDARPFRAEFWAWKHLSIFTFFFSTNALENTSEQELTDLLGKEVSLQFKGEKKVTANKMQDTSGNEMWSVSIMARHGDETLATVGIRFNPYPEVSEDHGKKRISHRAAVRNGVFKL
jgi:hypothetical protein